MAVLLVGSELKNGTLPSPIALPPIHHGTDGRLMGYAAIAGAAACAVACSTPTSGASSSVKRQGMIRQ